MRYTDSSLINHSFEEPAMYCEDEKLKTLNRSLPVDVSFQIDVVVPADTDHSLQLGAESHSSDCTSVDIQPHKESDFQAKKSITTGTMSEDHDRLCKMQKSISEHSLAESSDEYNTTEGNSKSDCTEESEEEENSEDESSWDTDEEFEELTSISWFWKLGKQYEFEISHRVADYVDSPEVYSYSEYEKAVFRTSYESEGLDFPIGCHEPARECSVCLLKRRMNVRDCCGEPICAECMSEYLKTEIRDLGRLMPLCPGTSCKQPVTRPEVIYRLKHSIHRSLLAQYQKLLDEANLPFNKSTCPRCSTVYTFDERLAKKCLKHNVKMAQARVICPCCELEWCWPCKAPWHSGLKCRAYKKGNVLVKNWSKLMENDGDRNAQQCPKCKTFVQRIAGCDHMHCPQCQCDFCYLCGERYISIRFIGDHHTKLSVLGCPYNIFKKKPIMRRTIRGSILGVKIVAVPVIATAAVAVGIAVLSAGLVLAPGYGVYRLNKRRRRMQRARREAAANSVVHDDDQFRDMLDELTLKVKNQGRQDVDGDMYYNLLERSQSTSNSEFLLNLPDDLMQELNEREKNILIVSAIEEIVRQAQTKHESVANEEGEEAPTCSRQLVDQCDENEYYITRL